MKVNSGVCRIQIDFPATHSLCTNAPLLCGCLDPAAEEDFGPPFASRILAEAHVIVAKGDVVW